MPLIKWSNEFTLKIPSVDKEHEVMSRMINCIYDSMLKGRDCGVVNRMADKLLHYTNKHFKNEEKVMLDDRYPDVDFHSLSHDKLLKELKVTLTDICTGNKRSIDSIAFLNDWFVDHLLIDDKKYGAYMNSKGVT